MQNGHNPWTDAVEIINDSLHLPLDLWQVSQTPWSDALNNFSACSLSVAGVSAAKRPTWLSCSVLRINLVWQHTLLTRDSHLSRCQHKGGEYACLDSLLLHDSYKVYCVCALGGGCNGHFHIVLTLGSLLLLLLLLSVHLYSALSLQIPNTLHALCQYLANRKHLSDRLK